MHLLSTDTPVWRFWTLGNGRMIYFGPASEARAYFETMGFQPKNRQTTADFLTSITDP